jgi:hypothetical protein
MVAANRQVKVSARFLPHQFEPDRDDSVARHGSKQSLSSNV